MISHKNIYSIIARYLSGECTNEEIKIIKDWLKEDSKRTLIYNEIYNLWIHIPIKQTNWDIKNEWDALSRKMDQVDDQARYNMSLSSAKARQRSQALNSDRGKQFSQRSIRLSYWFIRAAAAVLIVSFVSLFISKVVMVPDSENKSFTTMKEVVTEAGQRVKVQLEDGSTVQLNSGSNLTIPNEFDVDQRVVSLTGEAYFKVISEERPFIILSDDKKIEILGTEFNVQSYENEPFKVVVSEGIVAVNDPDFNENERSILHESEMHLNKDGKVNIYQNINLDLHLAWLDQRLVFEDTPFIQVARMLERWYGISVQMEESKLENLRVSASFNNEPVYEVILILSLSLNLDYEIDGSKVLFSSK